MALSGLKTPVSILQEYLVARRIIPQYEMTNYKIGTHKPEFTFRVQVSGVWEEGVGRSKQEAKHRAAEKMLKRLKVINDTTPEEDVKLALEPVENYVGQLKELCMVQRYPAPKYHLEESAGPSHNMIFKMVVTVSQLSDYGISRTKKQAKQEAAFKMLMRLKEVGTQKVDLPSTSTADSPRGPRYTDEEVFEKYNTLKPLSSPSVSDPAAFYKDHHRAFIELPKSSPTLKAIVEGNVVFDVNTALSLVFKVATELELTLNDQKVSSRTKPAGYTILSISTFPPVAAVGDTKDTAAFNLIESLLLLCDD